MAAHVDVEERKLPIAPGDDIERVAADEGGRLEQTSMPDVSGDAVLRQKAPLHRGRRFQVLAVARLALPNFDLGGFPSRNIGRDARETVESVRPPPKLGPVLDPDDRSVRLDKANFDAVGRPVRQHAGESFALVRPILRMDSLHELGGWSVAGSENLPRVVGQETWLVVRSRLQAAVRPP